MTGLIDGAIVKSVASAESNVVTFHIATVITMARSVLIRDEARVFAHVSSQHSGPIKLIKYLRASIV